MKTATPETTTTAKRPASSKELVAELQNRFDRAAFPVKAITGGVAMATMGAAYFGGKAVIKGTKLLLTSLHKTASILSSGGKAALGAAIAPQVVFGFIKDSVETKWRAVRLNVLNHRANKLEDKAVQKVILQSGVSKEVLSLLKEDIERKKGLLTDKIKELGNTPPPLKSTGVKSLKVDLQKTVAQSKVDLKLVQRSEIKEVIGRIRALEGKIVANIYESPFENSDLVTKYGKQSHEVHAALRGGSYDWSKERDNLEKEFIPLISKPKIKKLTDGATEVAKKALRSVVDVTSNKKIISTGKVLGNLKQREENLKSEYQILTAKRERYVHGALTSLGLMPEESPSSMAAEPASGSEHFSEFRSPGMDKRGARHSDKPVTSSIVTLYRGGKEGESVVVLEEIEPGTFA